MPAWNLFHAVGTQWRYAEGFRTGLDYSALDIVLKRRVAEELRDQRFVEVQIMEIAAVEAWEEMRNG
ncbi:DUF1799 domain-containing protein [Massilia endophytica]|nr:DUF1799 domain-containing protein [Massilia endophytica]